MINFLKKAGLVKDLLGLIEATAVLVSGFPQLYPQFGAVTDDLLVAASGLTFDKLDQLLSDVRTAYTAFAQAYNRDDASVQAFVDALKKIRRDL